MKIQTRLILYFVSVVTALMVGMAILVYSISDQYTKEIFYTRLYNKSLSTAKRRLEMANVDSSLLAKFDKYQLDIYPEENITVYDSMGREIYTNNSKIYYKTSPSYFKNIREKKLVRYQEGESYIVAFPYYRMGQLYYISGGAVPKLREGFLNKLKTAFLLAIYLSVIVIIFLGWLFVENALRPIKRIIAKVKTLSPIEKSERLPLLSERDEIAELVTTFNSLFDKLEDSYFLQKYFSVNVSHELNNPLTKIKSQLQVSLLQAKTTQEYQHLTHSLLEDVNELSTLIKDLMQFTKVSDMEDYDGEILRIDELAFEVRDALLKQQPQYILTIQFTNPPESFTPLVCNGNKNLVATAIRNIIENACKYSPNQSAFVNIEIDENVLFLSVHNTGNPIHALDLPHIFEPFYRSKASGSMAGYGIGLALAHKILKLHGYGISVISNEADGTLFKIQFSSE